MRKKVPLPPSATAQPPDTLRILRIAAVSRIVIVALIVFWRFIASPYDTSSSLNPPCLSPDPDAIDHLTWPVRWPAIGKAIEDSIVWDGVYFVRIAECGYEYEQTYAFLPLLPLCISLLARSVFAPFVPLLGFRAVLGLCAYVLNNLAFCLASVYFYRDVGFLRYFQLKQLPNFLFASPTLMLAVRSIIEYTDSDPKFVFSLGFLATCVQKSDITCYSPGIDRSDIIKYCSLLSTPKEKLYRRGEHNKHDNAVERTSDSYLQESKCCSMAPRHNYILVLPFVLHLTFLVVVAFFIMHVQVATRFLSSSPPIYWFISHLSAGASLRWSRSICVYFISYILLGSLLFSNFYPFT
ncbi:unnamed protein product [Victoria cruziana]